MVVPREALFTNYTRPLLAMLERRFASVNLIALDEYWFEGAMVKVALLLAEGLGPGVLRLHETRELGNLDRLIEAAPRPSRRVVGLVPDPRRLPSRAARALETPALAPLTDLASVLIGVVTGEKDYFLLPEMRMRELAIPRALRDDGALEAGAAGRLDLHPAATPRL
jgi:hypothetical protein